MIDKSKVAKPYEFGFHDGNVGVLRFKPGLNLEIVKQLSKKKNEDDRLLKSRLIAYSAFLEKKLPTWGPDLSFIDFDEYTYFIKPTEGKYDEWQKVPEKIRQTFERLGIPEAEAKFLNGVANQYDSEVIYNQLNAELKAKNVIFTDTDTAAKLYPDLFWSHFGKVVPETDNKFAALNGAVWSGGTFIYVPPGVKIEKPLQTYFRINGKKSGQFERTLIIVDEGAELHYIEGCTAPVFSTLNLHAAVVEVVVKKNATCRYTTLQNWSDNVINLVTKRAHVYESGNMSWIDGNMGSNINMKYPCSVLKGDNSSAEVISVAVAGKNIIQDAGAKMIHLGKNSRSRIISKSVSFNGGDTRYRGLVYIDSKAENSYAKIECDTLLMDRSSRTDTIPKEIVNNSTSLLEHEASVSKISDEQLFYVGSRGLNKEKSQHLIVMGFMELFTKELPMEYAVELNRLIELDMEGSVG